MYSHHYYIPSKINNCPRAIHLQNNFRDGHVDKNHTQNNNKHPAIISILQSFQFRNFI